MGQDKIAGLASTAGAAAVGLATFTADQGYWHASQQLLGVLWAAMWGFAALTAYFWGHWLWRKVFPLPEPGITIADAKIAFGDPPNGAGLAVTFAVVNSGPPVSLSDFKLHIYDPLGEITLTPEQPVYLGKTVMRPQRNHPGNAPYHETFSDRAVGQGEPLPRCYFRLEAPGDARTLYGSPMNKFALTARDSTGRVIRAEASVL